MTARSRLPDFLVIGAAKAATTWIVHQLQQHPDVFVPGPEPHFFSTEHARGRAWYEGWFADTGAALLAGEKSADYLAHVEAPARIAAMLPDVRMVVQLRNPIERAYSDYCMLLRRGTVGRSPEAYLVSGAPMARFLQDGLYFRHLTRFFDHFPRDRFAVLLHDDIRSRPDAAITRVCDHIGVVPRTVESDVVARINDGQTPILPLALRQALAPFKRHVAPLRDTVWFRAAHSAIARPPQYPPLTDSLRRRLRDFYADDVQQLSATIGRDLSHWLSIERQAA